MCRVGPQTHRNHPVNLRINRALAFPKEPRVLKTIAYYWKNKAIIMNISEFYRLKLLIISGFGKIGKSAFELL